MSNYDQQYFIISSPDDDSVPFLTPDRNTADRRFSIEQQPIGSPPLVFTNGWRERNAVEVVKDTRAPVLFHGSNLIVNSAIRQALLAIDVPGMHMHPTVYIDDRGNWHEDYWHLTFTQLFDCWDRATSKTSPPYSTAEHGKDYEIIVYGLNTRLLDSTPLESRLLFKMGGTATGEVFCHESIAGVFRAQAPSGAELTLVADF